MASNARPTEAPSMTSHAYARASPRLEASFSVRSVPRASSATAYPPAAKRRADPPPFPGPTPTTAQTGFIVAPPRSWRQHRAEADAILHHLRECLLRLLQLEHLDARPDAR